MSLLTSQQFKEFPEIVRAKAVCRKISFQFPSNPNGRLMCAVVCKAVTDAFDVIAPVQDRDSGHRYLLSSMPQATLCGVEAVWVRRLLLAVGLTLGKKHGKRKRMRRAL